MRAAVAVTAVGAALITAAALGLGDRLAWEMHTSAGPAVVVAALGVAYLTVQLLVGRRT